MKILNYYLVCTIFILSSDLLDICWECPVAILLSIVISDNLFMIHNTHTHTHTHTYACI